jgi:hypothetical protein
MTKPTHKPKGRPVTTPERGKPVEQIIEDPPQPPSFICYACSKSQPIKFKYCPDCGVENRWE